MTKRDPFVGDDTPAAPTTSSTPAAKEPTASGDNWASFSFQSAPGYDRVNATVHGSLDFIAESFGIKEYDGRISTLMKQAAKIDAFFKKQFAAGPPAGKG